MRLSLIFVLFISSVFAQDVPKPSAMVVDQAGLTSSAFQSSLSQSLTQLRSQSGVDIRLLVMKKN